MTVICYSRCSTCQKALRYLASLGKDFDERDIKMQNPTYAELESWHSKGIPLKKMFNTSGLVYRSLNLKDRLASMSEHEQLELLASDGMLVKRPIVIDGEKVLFGYSEIEECYS